VTQQLISSLASIVLLATLSGCASTSHSPPPGQFRENSVSYVDAKTVETISTDFGVTDLQLVSEKMVKSLLDTPIFVDRPTVTISKVRNKTAEYIDTNAVLTSIQTQLVRSGKVRFVRASNEMQAGLDELQRQNQSGLYRKDTRANLGRMIGAKYSLEGELYEITRQNAVQRDVYYNFTLKLFHIEDGIVEWQDEKEIRKISNR